jgi:hypothetical protein
MSKIVRLRQRIEIQQWTQFFQWKHSPGSGYSFECDAAGNLLDPTEDRVKRRNACFNEPGLEAPVIKSWTQRYFEPAVLLCDCGQEHALVDQNRMGDSCCECGQWYNAAGQQLIPPTQWGEDTGERFDERGYLIG